MPSRAQANHDSKSNFLIPRHHTATRSANDRLHFPPMRAPPRMIRPQTRHDVQRDQRLDILRHLAGHHDRVDHCGDRPVEKSRRASASVILKARSSHHRRRRRAPDSPGAWRPSRSGAAVTGVAVPRSQIRYHCRICSIAQSWMHVRLTAISDISSLRRQTLTPHVIARQDLRDRRRARRRRAHRRPASSGIGLFVSSRRGDASFPLVRAAARCIIAGMRVLLTLLLCALAVLHAEPAPLVAERGFAAARCAGACESIVDVTHDVPGPDGKQAPTP